MGGDGGVEMTLPACVEALRQDPDLGLMLIGNERCMQDGLKHVPEALLARISIIHTKDAVFDDDKPAQVLRKGRQSSMFKAIELVKDGKAQAMVSAGNTGALLLTGRHLLKTLPGIRKPAIVATLPGTSRQTFLLDVGANPECDGPQLFEFAVMGMVLAEALEGQPVSVGLLNIGAELHKGTAAVQEAAALMMDSPALDYAGFIEANELFEGAADVVVCDGFVGNVIIKSSAGVANVVKKLLRPKQEDMPPVSMQVDVNLPCISLASNDCSEEAISLRLSSQINPQRFNGASLLGLQGSVIKSHGNATSEGFFYAIQQAIHEVDNAIPQLIADRVANIMQGRPAPVLG